VISRGVAESPRPAPDRYAPIPMGLNPMAQLADHVGMVLADRERGTLMATSLLDVTGTFDLPTSSPRPGTPYG